MLSRNKYLQSERQNYVRLGELILVLLAHINDGSVVASLEFLQFELSTFRHWHALQIGHQQVH